jgi:hypothetical protein
MEVLVKSQMNGEEISVNNTNKELLFVFVEEPKEDGRKRRKL